MMITLEKLLKKIKSKPLDNVLSDTERTFMQILEYLRKKDLELYVKYYTKYEKIRNMKIVNSL